MFKSIEYQRIQLNLKGSWMESHIEPMNDPTEEGQAYFRWDYGDCDSSEQWDNYCTAVSVLAELGIEFVEPQVEHDCLTGGLRLLKSD